MKLDKIFELQLKSFTNEDLTYLYWLTYKENIGQKLKIFDLQKF